MHFYMYNILIGSKTSYICVNDSKNYIEQIILFPTMYKPKVKTLLILTGDMGKDLQMAILDEYMYIHLTLYSIKHV